jgi:ABC-2 type transport system ATP-binding protein
MARRIGLAQALINDPEFLILDEPTSGLDPIGARQIKDVIRELGRKGKTILLSSHILADVEDVCDRVTILYGGQQQAAGDINEILRKEDITQLSLPTVSADTINQIRDLVRRLENKDILDVTHPRVKLEEFFLKIVEEAQAANIRTYGARSGGAIPDFLKKPAETSEDLIESLVSAASPVSRSTAPSAAPLRESVPSGKVIDELLRGREEGESEPVEAVSGESHDESHGESSKVETTSQPALQRAADASVIDDLIGGSTGGSRKERS